MESSIYYAASMENKVGVSVQTREDVFSTSPHPPQLQASDCETGAKWKADNRCVKACVYRGT